MTVIAYDGRFVAADKQATNHGTRYTVTKLFADGVKVYGVNGDAAHGMMLIVWLKDGAKPADFPAPGKDGLAHLAVFEYGKPVRSYEGHPVPIVFEDMPYATGCGRDTALGAMAAGADVIKAVEITCRYDSHCGQGVTVFDLKELSSAAEPVRTDAPVVPGPAAAAPVGEGCGLE